MLIKAKHPNLSKVLEDLYKEDFEIWINSHFETCVYVHLIHKLYEIDIYASLPLIEDIVPWVIGIIGANAMGSKFAYKYPVHTLDLYIKPHPTHNSYTVSYLDQQTLYPIGSFKTGILQIYYGKSSTRTIYVEDDANLPVEFAILFKRTYNYHIINIISLHAHVSDIAVQPSKKKYSATSQS